MDRYEPLKIEAKWQAKWEAEKPFHATEDHDSEADSYMKGQ